MVYDHVIYNLNYIFDFRTNFFGGHDHLIGDTSAVLFMILCGISTNLSKNNLKHGLMVFGCAMSLTVITNLIDFFAGTSLSINFGILHLLGIAMIIAHFIKKLNTILIALITIISYPMPVFLKELNLPGNWFFPLGIHDNSFYSSDYYPLFPYLAFIFLGLLIGKILYKNRVSLFKFTMPDNPLSFIGRHSLILYITHQPVVILILYCIFYFVPKK